MKKLTSKALRILVKRHATLSDLLNEYHFSSEEELFQAIRKIYSHGDEAQRIFSAFQKNSKKANTPSPEQTQSPCEQTIEEHANPVEATKVELDISEQQANTEPLSRQAQLEAEEQSLSSNLIGLENQHKELVSQHLSSKKVLLRMQSILEEMQRLMSAHCTNLERELERIQATSAAIAEVSQKKRTVAAHLKEVRAELEELKKVSIFVYASGLLELENGEIPATVSSEETLQNKFMELIQYPRASEFSVTLKEINTVAKLLLWTEYLASSGLAFEISFDSEEVQRFYEAVTAFTTA